MEMSSNFNEKGRGQKAQLTKHGEERERHERDGDCKLFPLDVDVAAKEETSRKTLEGRIAIDELTRRRLRR